MVKAIVVKMEETERRGELTEVHTPSPFVPRVMRGRDGSSFAFEADAVALASSVGVDDCDWTYTVKQSGSRWVVVIQDEVGVFVGCL